MENKGKPASLAEQCTCGLTPASYDWGYGHVLECPLHEPILWKRKALRDTFKGATAPLCDCTESLCKGWGATAGICRDAASYSIPPRNVPQPIPATDLLDLLTAEVLSAATKPAIRQALGLLLHELGRRGMPPYSNLARNPALLAEQAAVIPPQGIFSSAEAAIAQGIDPTEAADGKLQSGFGATEAPSTHFPPEVTFITPGHLPLTTEAAEALADTSAGILQLKKDAQ